MEFCEEHKQWQKIEVNPCYIWTERFYKICVPTFPSSEKYKGEFYSYWGIFMVLIAVSDLCVFSYWNTKITKRWYDTISQLLFYFSYKACLTFRISEAVQFAFLLLSRSCDNTGPSLSYTAVEADQTCSLLAAPSWTFRNTHTEEMPSSTTVFYCWPMSSQTQTLLQTSYLGCIYGFRKIFSLHVVFFLLSFLQIL